MSSDTPIQQDTNFTLQKAVQLFKDPITIKFKMSQFNARNNILKREHLSEQIIANI